MRLEQYYSYAYAGELKKGQTVEVSIPALMTTALDIRKAISAEISDFEDAVMVETAVRSGADCIVTRNTKDYSKAPVTVYAPAEFIELLTETSEDQID